MDDLQTELAAALAATDPGAGAHPEADQLLAYRQGRLSATEADSVQEHLAACRHCADLLLALGQLEGTDAPAGPEISDFEEAAAWRQLRTRLTSDMPAPVQRDENPAASRTVGRAGGRGAAWGLAAAAAAIAIGLGLWVAVLRDELHTLRQPQVTAILSLEPIDALRGDEIVPTLTADRELFTIILTPQQWRPQGPHELEIRDSNERLLWSRQDLSPTNETTGNFYLRLSRHQLPPGDYSLRLIHPDKTFEIFRLRIAQPR